MRILYFIVVISLSMMISSGTLLGQEFPYRHIPIDVLAIQLKPPFSMDEHVQRQWKQLIMRFGNALGGLRDWYSEPLITEFITFISQHPTDAAALSAKYYLADYLRLSWGGLHARFGNMLLESENYERDLQLATELLNLIKDDMVRVYQEITVEAPETWQGRLAVYYTREYIEASLDKGAAYRERRRAMWPVLRDIQHERDFEYLWIFTEDYNRVEVGLSAEQIWFAIEEGNLSEAEAELARLKAKYPDLQQIEGFAQQIENAYKRQFEGDLHTIPDLEILRLLTSSQDRLEVKRAAAALGNLQIWGSLRLNDGDKSVITEVVFTYIDRALSGDAAERDAMIDLIYRLWQLAAPALLETLDHENPDRVTFAGERLFYMRNEEIITAIIAKARAATDDTKKAQLVGLLARMNAPCVPVMRFRECLPDDQLQELYQRLVVPALEELQATPTPTP